MKKHNRICGVFEAPQKNSEVSKPLANILHISFTPAPNSPLCCGKLNYDQIWSLKSYPVTKMCYSVHCIPPTSTCEPSCISVYDKKLNRMKVVKMISGFGIPPRWNRFKTTCSTRVARAEKCVKETTTGQEWMAGSRKGLNTFLQSSVCVGICALVYNRKFRRSLLRIKIQQQASQTG